jgi:hypothetical protein
MLRCLLCNKNQSIVKIIETKTVQDAEIITVQVIEIKTDYLVLYTFTVCVVKLAFHNKFLIEREDWDKLIAGPTPEYVDLFLRQQQEYNT